MTSVKPNVIENTTILGNEQAPTEKKEINWDDLHAFRKQKRRKKKDDWTEEEKILRQSREHQQHAAAERQRIEYFRQRYRAAIIIQRSWKMYKFKTKGLLKNARDAVRLKRLDAGELQWKKQIAACTIQLAWRKYARQKLLEKLNRTGSRVVHMWDSDMLALKQNYLLAKTYTEQLYAPAWHPVINPVDRPPWVSEYPSPAAISYNFAYDQYTQPVTRNLPSRLETLLSELVTRSTINMSIREEDRATTAESQPFYSYNSHNKPQR